MGKHLSTNQLMCEKRLATIDFIYKTNSKLKTLFFMKTCFGMSSTQSDSGSVYLSLHRAQGNSFWYNQFKRDKNLTYSMTSHLTYFVPAVKVGKYIIF